MMTRILKNPVGSCKAESDASKSEEEDEGNISVPGLISKDTLIRRRLFHELIDAGPSANRSAWALSYSSISQITWFLQGRMRHVENKQMHVQGPFSVAWPPTGGSSALGIERQRYCSAFMCSSSIRMSAHVNLSSDCLMKMTAANGS